MSRLRIKSQADTLGLALDAGQIERLRDFAAMLEAANKRFNLLSRREGDARDILRQHLKDSLRALRLIEGTMLADVGSGAGLPGVPLAIADTSRRMTLIERASRRCDFLRLVKTRLGLTNLEVLEADAREIEQASGFDTALARAFMKPQQALRILARLVKPNGRVVLFVGRQHARLPEMIDGRSVCALPGRAG